MRLTKRFMDWYQGNNDKEKETPKGGVKRVGYVLWNYAGRLVGVNVLFLLCCIPIVTIPAALSALNRYLSAIYRVGYGFSLEDYWKEFKSDILKNLPEYIHLKDFRPYQVWEIFHLQDMKNFCLFFGNHILKSEILEYSYSL